MKEILWTWKGKIINDDFESLLKLSNDKNVYGYLLYDRYEEYYAPGNYAVDPYMQQGGSVFFFKDVKDLISKRTEKIKALLDLYEQKLLSSVTTLQIVIRVLCDKDEFSLSEEVI